MSFEPLSRTRLFEDIVQQILDQIKSGDLKPGDKLPSERDLSEMLNVSRNSLREALRALEMMNFIEIKPGEGAIVREVTISNLLDPVTDAISIDQKLMLDLLDVREIIEIETARRAAIKGTEEDFKAILEIY
jgi:GntR family transcriptional regulator, transcriptional repressor for pyruvate dehydrogenase complex